MSYCAGLGQTAAQQSSDTDTALKIPTFPPVIGFGIPPFWVSIPVTGSNIGKIVITGSVLGVLFYIGKKILAKKIQ